MILEASLRLIYNVYSTGVTHDDPNILIENATEVLANDNATVLCSEMYITPKTKSFMTMDPYLGQYSQHFLIFITSEWTQLSACLSLASLSSQV